MDTAQLAFHIRTARGKAREAAIAEALSLLGGLGAEALPGGALSEKPRVFHVNLPASALDEARARLPRLGYTEAVDLLEPGEPGTSTLRWRRRDYRLVRLYEEDPTAARESAPDRRTFLLETADGEVRPVRGYRALSCDIDPALRHGLGRAAALHGVGDARRLPLGAKTVDAIATEPPFDRETGDLLSDSMGEMARVLKSDGRLAIMCADWQAEILRERGKELGLAALLGARVDRKGTACRALAWQKPAARGRR